MSSLIPKKPKFLNTRARKKDFDLSSEQEKTPIVEAETANTSYLPNSKPNKSNNQGDKNWVSNIEQEEKPVGKGKQKATSSTKILNGNKQTYQKMQTENISSSPKNPYISNMITEQDGLNTNVLNPNHLKENDSINTIDDQNLTFEKNTTSIFISKHSSPSIKANHKNTNNETPATNYDQYITIEPLDCNKKNKTEEKEFTLVISKKNN
ncbi:2060_t:CDS:2 [Cetraspora pellucida]|uniref:2060_t:CDS:1 n=1 Tax=Cetraspora pellucida TaxID=1433469 RepID=A0A9N9ATU6_9GLOM|nr:2060_t:CDS:2 [Cetraspora pellucida]